MHGLRNRLRSRAILVTAVASLLVATGHAQDEEVIKPDGPWREPGITYMEYSKPWVAWTLGVAFLLAGLVLAIKNPHRSHLD